MHPIRRGIPKFLSLDHDAHELLQVLCPSRKGAGLFISELIRKEAHEREDRPRLLATLRGKAGTGVVQEAERAVS